MKKVIGVIIFLFIFIGGFLAFPKELSDRINPFVPQEEVFVQSKVKEYYKTT